jgi:enoyl-CoA hydratase/carnithine racemase
VIARLLEGDGGMEDRVRLTITDGVAKVRLNRAAKMNALDPAMFQAIAEAGARLKDDRSLRAVVLSGEGRAFCAGMDGESVAAMAQGGSILPSAVQGMANRFQHIVWLWRELPVPVIAAVHGVAFGGGFQLALGADLRYVAPDTRLSVMETKWGLVPDMAGTQLMRHLAREDVVRELTYTARIFSAEQALAYGFATRLAADPLAEAMATARDIAGRSPRCDPRRQTAAQRSRRMRCKRGPRGREDRATRSDRQAEPRRGGECESRKAPTALCRSHRE